MIDIYLYAGDNAQVQYLKKELDDYIKGENIKAEIVLAAKKLEEFSAEEMHKKNGNIRLLFVAAQSEEYPVDGFTFVKDLRSHDCKNDYFVLLSSQKEQAYKVFEYGLDVLDYILTDSTLRDRRVLKTRLDRIFRIIGDGLNGSSKRKLFLDCGEKLLGIDERDILCIQTVKGTHMVDVFLQDQTIRVRRLLRELLDQLGDDFIMVSVDCLVSCHHVKEIERKTRCLTLENGVQQSISERHLTNVYTRLTGMKK